MFNANDKINGLYGEVINDNGMPIQGVTEFEVNIEHNKSEVPQAGVLTVGHKVQSRTITGSMTVDKITSAMQARIAEDPFWKPTMIGKLKDPTSRGEEAVLLIGVSFDGTQLTGFNITELMDFSLDFTVDDFKYLKKIL